MTNFMTKNDKKRSFSGKIYIVKLTYKKAVRPHIYLEFSNFAAITAFIFYKFESCHSDEKTPQGCGVF